MHVNQPVQLSRRQILSLRNLTNCNLPLLYVCFVTFIACVLELRAPAADWVWELMCSVDECIIFAIVLLLFQQILQRFLENILHGLVLFSWLRSSLWLQFKPHQIAAGAAYLAAKFLNLDLASYQTIWQEFQTTPAILQDVSQQLMELF